MPSFYGLQTCSIIVAKSISMCSDWNLKTRFCNWSNQFWSWLPLAWLFCRRSCSAALMNKWLSWLVASSQVCLCSDYSRGCGPSLTHFWNIINEHCTLVSNHYYDWYLCNLILTFGNINSSFWQFRVSDNSVFTQAILLIVEIKIEGAV